MAPTTTIRVAIITGAAQGIGRSIARRLAADGLAIVVSDIAGKGDALDELAAGIVRGGHRALAIPADVRDEEQVKALIARTVEEFGRLDVMVANAGIGLRGGSILDMDYSTVEATFAVNVRGVFFCYKHAAIQMVKQGNGGRILGASSIVGKRGFAKTGHYAMSKFAVRALTQSSALDLQEYGITVNAYAPGIIETPMTTVYDATTVPPTSMAKTLLKIPEAKTGQPEDVASLVSYLAKPESHFITGQTITVDGGVIFD